MNITDNKFQREKCKEFIPSIGYLKDYMERFDSEFPNLKPGYDSRELRSVRHILGTNLEILKGNFKKTIYSNDGTFVTFDVGVPTGMNF